MSSKASRKRAKLAAEFELNPPRCGNCKHYVREVFAVPNSTKYTAPHCPILNVAAKPHSICNNWIDIKTGETLA